MAEDLQPSRRRATPEEVSALASAVRLRILRLTLDAPMTNRELADRLGVDPATALYHVRRLVAVGLLAADPARPRPAGGVEIPYRATRRSWALELTEEEKPTAAMLDAFLSEVREAGLERIEQAIRLRATLNHERRRELVSRLYALFDEYAATDDPDGQPWALFFAMHPGEPPGADRSGGEQAS
ncbi:ArsR/SmtB family transcription factor [Geodermatophilus sp. SYSU D00815]